MAAKISEAVKAKIVEIVEFCKAQKFNAELVGCWVWVTFDGKPEPEIRQTLKDAGFRWIRKREKWAHNCGRPCRAGKGKPWEKYETASVSRAS